MTEESTLCPDCGGSLLERGAPAICAVAHLPGARDHIESLRAALETVRERAAEILLDLTRSQNALRNIRDAAPQSYVWYQRTAATALKDSVRPAEGSVTLSFHTRAAEQPSDRCNEAVAAWKFVQPMRCNLERGHAGECYHV